MLSRLILLFILVPLADLVLLGIFFMENWIATIILVVVSGIIGAYLTRRQGVSVANEIRQKLTQGEMPTEALGNGALILFAGGLLLTPGLLTDLFGMSILIPPCRRWYRERIMASLKRRFNVSTYSSPFSTAQNWRNDDDENVIDSYVVSSSEDKEQAES